MYKRNSTRRTLKPAGRQIPPTPSKTKEQRGPAGHLSCTHSTQSTLGQGKYHKWLACIPLECLLPAGLQGLLGALECVRPSAFVRFISFKQACGTVLIVSLSVNCLLQKYLMLRDDISTSSSLLPVAFVDSAATFLIDCTNGVADASVPERPTNNALLFPLLRWLRVNNPQQSTSCLLHSCESRIENIGFRGKKRDSMQRLWPGMKLGLPLWEGTSHQPQIKRQWTHVSQQIGSHTNRQSLAPGTGVCIFQGLLKLPRQCPGSLTRL